MRFLPADARVVGTQTAVLPRVNLLPPEITERAAFRRVQLGLGGGVLAAVGLVGLLYVSATHGVTHAQSDLDSANSSHARLQTQAAKYRGVTTVYTQAAAAEAQLAVAMGDEVRYSQLLNDLSLNVPKNVWLKSVAYMQTPPVSTATPGALSVAPSAGGPAIGTFTVSGVGFSHDDVAAWLDSIALLKTYRDPSFSSSTEALIGIRKSVNFSATAAVTSGALSGRFTKAGG